MSLHRVWWFEWEMPHIGSGKWTFGETMELGRSWSLTGGISSMGADLESLKPVSKNSSCSLISTCDWTCDPSASGSYYTLCNLLPCLPTTVDSRPWKHKVPSYLSTSFCICICTCTCICIVIVFYHNNKQSNWDTGLPHLQAITTDWRMY